MILYPPERFDANEWFILGSIALVFTILFLLPRRFSLVEITVIAVFNVFLSQTVDSLIAVAPFDLYDVSDTAKYEIMDVVIYYLLYPPMAYIFLNLYDRWRLTAFYLSLYVIGFSLISVLLEWISVKLHVFTYKGWHLSYSPYVYTGVYTFNILMLHLTRRLTRSGN